MEDEPEIQVFSKRRKNTKGIRNEGTSVITAAADERIKELATEKSGAEPARAPNAAAQEVKPPSAASTGRC